MRRGFFIQAVNTFKGKFGYVPGDIPDPTASQFGFAARGLYKGEGDGNGQLEGIGNPPTSNTQNCGIYQRGEPTMFWVDLSQAGLIEGGFNTATTNNFGWGNYTSSSTPSLNSFYPQAKLGQGNYIYAWSGGYNLQPGNIAVCNQGGNGTNYFGLQTITTLVGDGTFLSQPGLTVQQAYSIDKKMDDGLPQSGNVLALYVRYYSVLWAAGGTEPSPPPAGLSGAADGSNSPTNASTPGTPTTCYDNASGSGPQQYSITQNNGTGTNCALSFKLQ